MTRRGRDPTWGSGWALSRFTRLVRDISTRFPGIHDSMEDTENPAIDVLERDGVFVVRVEAPGLAIGDMRLSLGSGTLVVEGYKKRKRDPGCLRFFCLEREYGYFRRTVDIPGPVNSGAATARLDRGLLVVEIPRVADRRRDRIAIPITD